MKTKKNLLSTLLLLIIATSYCFAIDYTISFTGTGASSSIDSVVVKNLTKGSSLTLKSGFDLNLSDNTNSLDQLNSNKLGIYVSMNAIHGNSIVTFYANQTGETHINVFGTDGRKILGKTENLQEGTNSFELSLPKGNFIVKINGKGYTYSTKLGNETGMSKIPAITIVNNEKSGNVMPQRIKNSSVLMNYSNGDLLLYKGFSGNLRTIVTEVPTKSKSTNFEFVECKDANQNYYTVVKIGSQTWMAENLTATAYRNNDPISIITSDTEWSTSNVGSCCNFNNDIAKGQKYGKLYNWYAASDVRNVAPEGWHVSDSTDWHILIKYLGGSVLAGAKLKEIGITWKNPNYLATNESGFSALPGAFRFYGGGFSDVNLSYGIYNGYWWTSTPIVQVPTGWAFNYNMGYSTGQISETSSAKRSGFSIRCVKD